ncbi:MAG: glycosyltransferase family 2 protein [Phycisphaerales bacterium JB039]
MITRPDVSILIPTHGRTRKLCACLRALAHQSVNPAQMQILIGFDGPDATGARAARDAWASAGAGPGLELIQCPRAGYNAARNHLLERAAGHICLSLNDDVLPAPGFVDAHIQAQRQAADRLGLPGAVIVGRSRWVIPHDDTLFDRLVRSTPMIFFYDVMDAAAHDPDACWRNWGFRHAWGLNMSAPLELVRQAGGFTDFPMAYGHDDIELAWRLGRNFDLPVLYRPEAEAAHDHRYSAVDVLDRERKLGESAWLFAGRNPHFGRDVFGRDITSDAEIAYAHAFVQREAKDAERLRTRFLSLEEIPADAIGAEYAPALLDALYQQHILLKRYEWRTGLLRAATDASDRAGGTGVSPVRREAHAAG